MSYSIIKLERNIQNQIISTNVEYQLQTQESMKDFDEFNENEFLSVEHFAVIKHVQDEFDLENEDVLVAINNDTREIILDNYLDSLNLTSDELKALNLTIK